MRTIAPLLALTLLLALAAPGVRAQDETGVVRCANLVYGDGKSSECFAEDFLKQIEADAHVQTTQKFDTVGLESLDLFSYPFSVMTGDGNFTLTPEQRTNLRDYLEAGGFVVASASCSSKPWNRSFEGEMKAVFPDVPLKKLEADHPVFHTVYDISSSKYKSGGEKLPELFGLELDGRIVLIWSPDGLNDTTNAAPECCCCGGNEIKSAKQINVNLLAYALTH